MTYRIEGLMTTPKRERISDGRADSKLSGCDLPD